MYGGFHENRIFHVISPENLKTDRLDETRFFLDQLGATI
jgi:hypothetical protein